MYHERLIERFLSEITVPSLASTARQAIRGDHQSVVFGLPYSFQGSISSAGLIGNYAKRNDPGSLCFR